MCQNSSPILSATAVSCRLNRLAFLAAVSPTSDNGTPAMSRTTANAGRSLVKRNKPVIVRMQPHTSFPVRSIPLAAGDSDAFPILANFRPSEHYVRIVGIVESPVERNIDNVRGPSIVKPSPSGEVAAIFFPSPLQNGTARTLYVRAGGPAGPLAPAIREIVAQIDPRVPLLELATLDQKIRSDTTSDPPRAGEGGGSAGHRGAPARQRRPVRSDLL